MGDWYCEMGLEEIQGLTAEDVVAVFMVHQAVTPPVTYDYEEHVMNYVLPKLVSEGFRNWQSVWGADPDDSSGSSPVGKFIRGNGYDRKGAYQVASQKVNAGEGVTSLVIILHKKIMGRSVVALP